jgi:ATP-dependent Lon protease
MDIPDESFVPNGLKQEMLSRYLNPGSSPEKTTQWLQTVIKIPYGVYAKQVTREDLSSSLQVLNKAIYGHHEAKHKLRTYIAQLIRNQDSEGLILGIHSYPGVGKTNLVDSGVSQILKRPFYSMSLGGIHDSTFLKGFQFTYESSEPGYIARSIINSKIMNPVFFFDELDKVSKTAQGDEIIDTLIQITDPIQSKIFNDRYLGSTCSLDLSRCVFVFVYNDRTLLNPILRDRLTEIELEGFSDDDKVVIAKDYIVPRVLSDIGLSVKKHGISEESIRFIIENYTNEAGVRHLRRVIKDIFMEVNMRLLIEGEDTTMVGTLGISDIRKLITCHKPVTIDRIIKEKAVGKVNGLFVDCLGRSGILPLQAKWIPASKKSSYTMRCTGNLGKVMGESIQVAWSVAWNILTKKKQQEWLSLWYPQMSKLDDLSIAARQSGRSSDLQDVFQSPVVVDSGNSEICAKDCIHVHCSDNAVPKDGPSAGVAMTILLWSMLMEFPLPQEFAYTGEVDLHGNILSVGGLAEKLVGAKRAGCEIVVIPEANAIVDVPLGISIVPLSSVHQVLAQF